MPAAGYHYKNAIRYAKEINCKVWFINYRLAPKYQFPIFFEDCFNAICYLYDNAESFGIDLNRICIGGDSAGATLSVGVSMMLQDRKHPINFSLEMLIYPFLDMRGVSESNKKYTDTPMWNSKLSDKIAPMTNVSKEHPFYVYYSPVEAPSFKNFPQTYIETTEFDCLHDDGIIFAKKLQSEGVEVVLNETKGTMHGYDIVQKAKTTQQSLKERIEYIKKRI